MNKILISHFNILALRFVPENSRERFIEEVEHILNTQEREKPYAIGTTIYEEGKEPYVGCVALPIQTEAIAYDIYDKEIPCSKCGYPRLRTNEWTHISTCINCGNQAPAMG